MDSQSYILVVNCSPAERQGILDLPPSSKRSIDFVEKPTEGGKQFQDLGRYDVIFVGIDSPRSEEARWLEMACQSLPGTPVVVISHIDDGNFYMDCLHQGAFDYIPRPVDWREFDRIYSFAIQHRTYGRKSSIADPRE